MDKDFEKLLAACHELSAEHAGAIVFIGGIAVYLHAINGRYADLAEATHDGDFYISMTEMSALRDTEDVVPNRRLSKHQIIRNGFEFDIYTERHSSLVVPYDEVVANAVPYDQILAAAPEHLLPLKLEAYGNRKASSKGDKDAMDIVRICLFAADEPPRKFDAGMAAKYLTAEHVNLLRQVARSPMVAAIAHGNAKVAKGYREKVTAIADLIEGEHGD